MKQLLFLFILFCTKAVFAQPSQEHIQTAIKKQMGANCTQVTVTGTGKTVKEFENGVWT
ncbi:MAG: hypothetical protein RLY16_2401, partial [Bacteroidota bacterium]